MEPPTYDYLTILGYILFSLSFVFFYLWYLITNDLKNFKQSRKAYSEYTAKDPVNCYQNYEKPKNE